jgi:hypothetical protein
LLWDAFKERLGTTKYTRMHFSRILFLESRHGLEVLTAPFTHEDIDSIVKQIPNDKSSGPDGFNTKFMKTVGWSSHRISIIAHYACIVLMDLI